MNQDGEGRGKQSALTRFAKGQSVLGTEIAPVTDMKM